MTLSVYTINIIDVSTAGVKRLTPSRLVAVAMSKANDPSNHHAKFEIFVISTADFIKIPKVSNFSIGLYYRKLECHCTTYGKIAHSREFYKISSRSNLVW